MELSPSRLKRSPVIHNFNQTERTGRITKRGSNLVRTALVQCALIAKRYSPYLANYYEHQQPARNRSRHHRPWPANFWELSITCSKTNGVFQDFRNFVLREATA